MSDYELIEEFFNKTVAIRQAIDSVGTRVYQRQATRELLGLASQIADQHCRILELENVLKISNLPRD